MGTGATLGGCFDIRGLERAYIGDFKATGDEEMPAGGGTAVCLPTAPAKNRAAQRGFLE